MAKKRTLKAEVRATTLETKSFRAKRGDVVEIPADEKEQSPAVKHALNTGNLVVIDLKPVTSENAPKKVPEEK